MMMPFTLPLSLFLMKLLKVLLLRFVAMTISLVPAGMREQNTCGSSEFVRDHDTINLRIDRVWPDSRSLDRHTGDGQEVILHT
jgi:hypothetical protein